MAAEPRVFVIDPHGVICFRFDNVGGSIELRQAIEKVIWIRPEEEW